MKNIITFSFINSLADKSANRAYDKIKDNPKIIENIKHMLESIKKVKYDKNELTDNDYIQLFNYSYKFIYGFITKGFLLLFISYILNITKETLVVAGAFGIIRIFSGGLHFKSYVKCTIISITTIILLGLFSKYTTINICINTISFLLTGVCILKFAPVENSNRKYKSYERKKFKSIALINLVLLLVLNMFICNTSVVFGIILAGIITLPVVNRNTQC